MLNVNDILYAPKVLAACPDRQVTEMENISQLMNEKGQNSALVKKKKELS